MTVYSYNFKMSRDFMPFKIIKKKNESVRVRPLLYTNSKKRNA